MEFVIHTNTHTHNDSYKKVIGICYCCWLFARFYISFTCFIRGIWKFILFSSALKQLSSIETISSLEFGRISLWKYLIFVPLGCQFFDFCLYFFYRNDVLHFLSHFDSTLVNYIFLENYLFYSGLQENLYLGMKNYVDHGKSCNHLIFFCFFGYFLFVLKNVFISAIYFSSLRHYIVLLYLEICLP